MSNYTKTVDFAAKDALLTGNPAKAAKGTEVDTEFNNIATAVATKVDTSTYTSGLAAKLDASSYTASDVLTKVKTVDGTGSGLDADTVDGVEYSTISSAISAKLDSSSYTASDVLTKIKTVDGSGSGLDADTLDGVDSTGFAAYSSGTFTMTLTGATTSPTATANWQKIGSIVYISLPLSTTLTGTASGGGIGFTGIPVGARPSVATTGLSVVFSNGANTVSFGNVFTDGHVTFNAGTTGTSGFGGLVITFTAS